MPFLQNFVKITAQGDLSGVDIFNYSIHLIGGTSVNTAIDQLYADSVTREAIVARIQSLHSGSAGSASFVSLDSVKFAYIGTNGKYFLEAQTANFAPIPGNYNGGANTTAFTGAAISLQGDVPRDAAGRGRYYPPANAVSTSQGFYIGGERQSDLAEAHATFISDVNELLSNAGIALTVGIVSEKGSGAQQIVRTVRVGSVLDVQRRRKNRAYESYVNFNVDA